MLGNSSEKLLNGSTLEPAQNTVLFLRYLSGFRSVGKLNALNSIILNCFVRPFIVGWNPKRMVFLAGCAE